MGTGRAHGLVAAGPPRARRRHRAELHGRACERPHLTQPPDTTSRHNLQTQHAPDTPGGSHELTPDHMEQDGVPRGTVTAHEPLESSVYPLTERAWWTYVPAQYDPATPAPVLFFQDGAGYLAADGVCRAPTVLDNLIAKGEIPPTIGVFLNPGVRRAGDGSYHPQVSVNKMPDGREVAGDGQQRSFE